MQAFITKQDARGGLRRLLRGVDVIMTGIRIMRIACRRGVILFAYYNNLSEFFYSHMPEYTFCYDILLTVHLVTKCNVTYC